MKIFGFRRWLGFNDKFIKRRNFSLLEKLTISQFSESSLRKLVCGSRFLKQKYWQNLNKRGKVWKPKLEKLNPSDTFKYSGGVITNMVKIKRHLKTEKQFLKVWLKIFTTRTFICKSKVEVLLNWIETNNRLWNRNFYFNKFRTSFKYWGKIIRTIHVQWKRRVDTQ